MRYENLTNRLINCAENSVTFSFEELNTILDGRLPNCARNHPYAHFSNSTGNSYSIAWMSVGFKAKYNKDSESVTFYRVDTDEIETPNIQRRNRSNNENRTLPSTLVIKNFSGSFNENGVGHEILNSFAANNNREDYYIFYVPPYGSVFTETIDFINREEYRSINKIIVFDSTTITNVLKLKAVIINPICIESEEEMQQICTRFQYGPNNTPLSQIDFNDDEFQSDRDESERVTLFPFTYKVSKNLYYNLESDNIFIWHSRTVNTNNLQNDSIRKFHIVYGENTNITILNETTLGEKNYSYNLGNDLEDWFSNIVNPLLDENHIWELNEVPHELNITYLYNKDNFLEYVKKLTDENLYTNFICSILKSSNILQNNFFSYLVEKYFNTNGYMPSNLGIEPQCQSLVPPKKCANEYLNAIRGNKTAKINKLRNKLLHIYNMTEEQINTLSRFIDGQMDIYLHDDNYRIAIENKILSGINGKHADIDEDINQLRTYKTFLNDLNEFNIDGVQKQNKVILLTPENVKNNFVNYDHEVPVMSYRDLAEFFTSPNNYALIPGRYRSDFLNAIYKHSVTREEEIKIRFFNSLNNN